MTLNRFISEIEDLKEIMDKQAFARRVDLWKDRHTESQKSFIDAMFISSIPFLGIVFLILVIMGILSCIFTFKKKRKRREAARHIQILENFLVLVSESKNERKQREKAIKLELELEEKKNQEENEEEKQSVNEEKLKEDESNRPYINLKSKLSQLNFKKSMIDLCLEDENKVPIVLVNDALSKSACTHENSQSVFFKSNYANIEMDEEVIECINELINPPELRKNSKNVIEKKNSVVIEVMKKIRKFSVKNDSEDEQDATDDSPKCIIKSPDPNFKKKSSLFDSKKDVNKNQRVYFYNRSYSTDDEEKNENKKVEKFSKHEIKIVIEDYDKKNQSDIPKTSNDD